MRASALFFETRRVHGSVKLYSQPAEDDSLKPSMADSSAGAPLQQPIVLAPTLWLLIAPSLLQLAWHLIAACWPRRRGANVAANRSRDWASLLGMATVGCVTGATLAHAIALVQAPKSAAFVEYVTSGARVGRVDAGIAFDFDSLSAVACLLLCMVAFGAATWLAMHPAVVRSSGKWACIELALAGGMVSFLADGVVTMAIGWTLAATAAAGLAVWTDLRAAALAATRAAAAIALLLLGGAVLFWRLEGAKQDSAAQGSSGFVALRSSDPRVHGSALTLASVPGALVYLDGARTPLARAPFVGVPIPSGPHSIRVHSGSASDDAVITEEASAEGTLITLVPSGLSLSFREVGAAIAAGSGEPSEPAGDDGGAATALWLWIAAAWVVSAGAPPANVPAPLVALSHGATTAILGPFLLGRASVLLALAPRKGLVLAAAVAAILVAATRSLWSAASRPGNAVAGATAWLLDRSPARAGALLIRFEHWVVDAIGGLVGTFARIAAWGASRLDARLFRASGVAIGTRVAGLGRGAEPIVGMPLGRVAWVVMAALATAAVAYGLLAGQ
jgi:hypothetical protein